MHYKNYIEPCWDFPLLLNNTWGYVIVVSTLNSKQFLNNILLFKHLIQTCCYLFNRVIYKSFVSNFNVCLASWVPFSSSESWHQWPIWGEIVCIAHACFFMPAFFLQCWHAQDLLKNQITGKKTLPFSA